jgi:hypothetical protein
MRFFNRGRRWGMVVLAIWLILSGLLGLIPALNFSNAGLVLAVLALAAGILLLIDR